jgi:hypothetical protein
MANEHRDLIITAASEKYTQPLLAFLGSLRCNWPAHPPVRIYDIDLSQRTTEFLRSTGYDVRKIPAFVPHWRQHYSWKLWCMSDASAERVLWLDAGCCILRPFPEVFDIIEQQGYFALPNYCSLEIEASEQACEGCGVAPEFRVGKVTVTAAVFGFRRGSAAHRVVDEAIEVAKTERFIKASKPWHRWEQAILSLLLYREISPLVLCDGSLYFYEERKNPKFVMQSIWAARRHMHYKDKKFFAASIIGPASPHVPRPSHKETLWYWAARQPKVALLAIIRWPKMRKEKFEGVR